MTKKILILMTALITIPLLVLSLAGCTEELTLTVHAPSDGYTLKTSPVIVRGTVSNPKATVKVNDVTVQVDDQGDFSTTIEPLEGKNIITITAIRGDKTVTKTVTVTYTPSP